MGDRRNAWAPYRIVILGIVGLLALSTLLYLRGPSSWQRRYYPLRYRDAIESAAVRHRVSPYLIAAVIDTESDWEASAKSRVGALGLMQLMPSTAEELSKRGLVDAKKFPPADLKNPSVNIEYGAAYLRYLVERYHEIETALAAYNAGLGNVDVWARKGGNIREHIDFPETKAFVLKVSRAKDRYVVLYPDAFPSWRK